MRKLIIGNGNVTRAFLAILDSLGERRDITVCDSHEGMSGERMIREHHDCFDAVLNLSSAPTGALIDLCQRHGLAYLDTAYSWPGDDFIGVAEYAANVRDELRPREGVALLHGFGMNPGLVEVILALYAPKRPYFALEVDTDTAEAAAADAPKIWGTWCPENHWYETAHASAACSTRDAFLKELPEALHHGRRLTAGGREFDFSVTVHDETGYMVTSDPNCRGAVFLYAAPRVISEHFRALLAAGRELEEGVPVLHDLKGEECVGVAFYDGTDASIRYVMNRGDHAKAFRSFGCNGTCWQVACGVYAGMRLLGLVGKGESLTVSSAMRIPAYRACILSALERVGFSFETLDGYLDVGQVRSQIMPLFA